MPKILFIAAHRPGRSPSQRFRFEQYLSYFESQGYRCELSWLISEADDKVLYSPGKLFAKLRLFLSSISKRSMDVRRAKDYDVVFVQREAFMTGSYRYEKRISKSGAKLVFDFDDALWLLDTSDANKKLDWLKDPGKTAKIIAVSHAVIAGNEYLATYARKHNKNVVVIPTTIDTSVHKKTPSDKKDGRICIGWTGSITTIKHFEYAVPFLLELKKKYGDKIYFKVIGDDTYRNEALGIKGHAWKGDTEVKDLSEIDIGIMPLPDDKWAKGKCGLKGLSYMAMEIPAVMSPVGVNAEIIAEGRNGFLASTNADWVEKISKLIDDAALRQRIGAEARKTVEERYSLNSQKEKYLDCFRKLLSE